jgi:GT2 family glycosyltransferase
VAALVIDNASTDDTVEVARQQGAEVIANPENRGFAGAVNQGFRATNTPLVLILNPDVSLTSSLEPLESAASRFGVAGGRLTDDQGQTQAGFTIRRFPTPAVLWLELLGLNRLWPSNSANRKYRYLDRDLAQPGSADQPAGAFLMVRRDVWERLNGMDESFWPIWFEDVDFCRRAATLGFQPYYEPIASARHLGGHSIKKLDRSSKQVFWYDSLLRYAGKHYTRGQYRWTCAMALLGAGPRAVLGFLQDRSFKEVKK